MLEFTPDPDKTNGATESTVLVAVIDRRLMEWLRTQKRYQGMLERCGAMLPSGDELTYDSSVEASDAAIDVESVLAGLPEFERQVGKLLSEGHSAYSIADELGVGRRAVNSAIDVIRERFTSAGLGVEEFA